MEMGLNKIIQEDFLFKISNVKLKRFMQNQVYILLWLIEEQRIEKLFDTFSEIPFRSVYCITSSRVKENHFVSFQIFWENFLQFSDKKANTFCILQTFYYVYRNCNLLRTKSW